MLQYKIDTTLNIQWSLLTLHQNMHFCTSVTIREKRAVSCKKNTIAKASQTTKHHALIDFMTNIMHSLITRRHLIWQHAFYQWFGNVIQHVVVLVRWTVDTSYSMDLRYTTRLPPFLNMSTWNTKYQVFVFHLRDGATAYKECLNNSFGSCVVNGHLVSVKTSCTMLFFYVCSHQIRHQSTRKLHSQYGDCRWPVSSSSGVCMGMYGGLWWLSG